VLSPRDTAYPLLKPSPSEQELDEVYTPTLFELSFAERRTREPVPRLSLLVLLKTFQRLGYLVKLAEVPQSILRHVCATAGYSEMPQDLTKYDSSSLRFRHMTLVLSWGGVTPFDRTGHRSMLKACVEASRVREDLADIINFAIEELVRQRYELPTFPTLLKVAQKARAAVNRGLYTRITKALDEAAKARLDQLFARINEGRRSAWDQIKSEPRPPTAKEIKRFVAHLNWLREQAGDGHPLAGIPVVKVNRFAAEARALNVARMNELIEEKRYALAAALVFRQRAQSFDDAGEMLIRQVRKIEARAQDLFEQRQAEYLEKATGLIRTLHEVALAYAATGTSEERLQAIGSWLGPDLEQLLQQCEEHAALVSGNPLRLLPPLFRHARAALLLLLEHLPLEPTTQDDSLHQAITFVLAHKSSRAEMLSIVEESPGSEAKALVNLSFVPEAWWPLVTRTKNRTAQPRQVDRQFFELCVLSQVATDLKANDLCLPLGTKLGDYRERLVSWETYQQVVPTYGERMNLPIGASDFVARLRSELHQAARTADAQFPQNPYLRIEHGEPVLSPVRAHPDPVGLARMEQLLKDRLEPVEILDALVDTEHWLNWTHFFGPLSGFEAKIKRPRERYVLTVFCYGCNLGPVQTARSVRGTDRFQLAFLNQRHITEATLNEAITTVVNAYAQFPLPRLWGSGQSASADGMKWDLYPQNLMAEYHIRYGGYGGIGYYLLSDSYIALVSRFTTCGSWEGHYILDFLKENESDLKPDTIHADTQGQSTAIFGLAYLLGIQLMPRIRNWKDQHLFRPEPSARYEHIDDLFTAQVDWALIETMVPDLLRVAVSIQTGAMLPSDILRRLSSASRKNKLYFALRELGRVVRTMFLLRYLSDVELRHTIQTATTKSERFNHFVQWVSFGGDSVIAENVRDEQRKFIKYNHLVANLLTFHNLVNMTRALQRLEAEGHTIPDDVLARFSPYPTGHINRFGNYFLHFGRDPVPIPMHFRKPPQSEPSPKIITLPIPKADFA